MTKNTTAEKASLAREQKAALEERLRKIEGEIQAATEQLGDGFLDVADGGEVNKDAQRRLADLLAEKMALESMIKRAAQHVKSAERRLFARGIVAGADGMRELLSKRDQLADEAEKHLAAFASVAAELLQNGAHVVNGIHRLRGRNRSTGRGEIALELASLAQPRHLQHLLMIDLVRRIRGLQYDAMPPYGGHSFAVGMRDATAALRGEFHDVMGLVQLDAEELAEIKAELAADGISGGDALTAAEDGFEALISALPDF